MHLASSGCMWNLSWLRLERYGQNVPLHAEDNEDMRESVLELVPDCLSPSSDCISLCSTKDAENDKQVRWITRKGIISQYDLSDVVNVSGKPKKPAFEISGALLSLSNFDLQAISWLQVPFHAHPPSVQFASLYISLYLFLSLYIICSI